MMNFTQIPILSGIQFEIEYRRVLNKAIDLGYTLPSSLQQMKQNSYVKELKELNLWDSLDVLYVFANDAGSSFATINWKDPNSYQATLNNSPTFTNNLGITGNASNMYIDLNFAPSNGVNYTQNDASVIIANSAQSGTLARVDIGCNQGAGTRRTAWSIRNSSTAGIQTAGLINRTGTTHTFANATGHVGFWQFQLTSGNSLKVFKDATQIGATATTTTASLSTNDFFVLCENANGTPSSYSSTRVTMVAMASALASNETNLYNTWNTYYTSL